MQSVEGSSKGTKKSLPRTKMIDEIALNDVGNSTCAALRVGVILARAGVPDSRSVDVDLTVRLFVAEGTT